MKRLVLLSAGLLLISSLSAQWSGEWRNSARNKHLLYANGDLMVGNNSGGNLGMTFVYECKYSVEVGYSATSNKFSTPVSGLKSTDIDDGAGTLNPTLMMENFNIMVGRHYNLNSKKSIRFVMQGGAGMSVMIEGTNNLPFKNADGYIQGELSKTNEVSLMVNTKFEFPIIDLLGFSAGPTLILNQDKSFLSFNVGIMYGIISKY